MEDSSSSPVPTMPFEMSPNSSFKDNASATLENSSLIQLANSDSLKVISFSNVYDILPDSVVAPMIATLSN